MIQDNVKKPLAEELLFGKLAKGGVVKVDAVDGALTFEFQPPEDGVPSKPPTPALAP